MCEFWIIRRYSPAQRAWPDVSSLVKDGMRETADLTIFWKTSSTQKPVETVSADTEASLTVTPVQIQWRAAVSFLVTMTPLDLWTVW